MSGACSCCRKRPVHVRKYGWCRACYDRWRLAGRPDTGPPEPSKGGRPREEATARRVEETKRLMQAGCTVLAIAHHLQVASTTVYYYRSRVLGEAAGK